MTFKSIYEINVTGIDGSTHQLGEYVGKVVLIVNTASKCGFTPQYQGLQKLYDAYKDKGFVVLGFPCNQFMNQEPGDEASIASFCELNFGVTFPMFAKVNVNGKEAHPLFAYLSSTLPGLMNSKKIKWNFTKFLIDRQGKPVKRYAPSTEPEALIKDIEKLLEA